MTPANERKAKERKAKREAGLVPIEVWVYPEMRGPIQDFITARVNLMRIARESAATLDPPTKFAILHRSKGQ